MTRETTIWLVVPHLHMKELLKKPGQRWSFCIWVVVKIRVPFWVPQILGAVL